MTCIESGDHPLQINWTKNGADLGNRNNNTYTVDHVTFDHAGLYGCTAVNWAGKTHTMFWIDVTGKVLTSYQSLKDTWFSCSKLVHFPIKCGHQ